MNTTFRNLSENEAKLVGALFAHEFIGRDALARQLEDCQVATIDDNGSLQFSVVNPLRATVRERIPVEAQYTDHDGIVVHVLLHVVEGVLQELEIYKDDSSRVVDAPHTADLEIWAK